MYALATLFDLDQNPSFSRMWLKLQQTCRLVTAKQFSFVHLSWQGAENYRLEPARAAIAEIAAQTRSFSVKTAGLGIFTGNEPVLYLNLVKDCTMVDLHEALWRRLWPHSDEMNGFYAPREWVPHITLVYKPLLPDNLACAITELMYEPYSVELEINNLALIFLRDRTVGIDCRFDLQAG